LARREGDREKAIVLYDALQNLHPSAPEARAAEIALGMLQLQKGAAGAALKHFRRYLRDSPNGDLAPEASWGEAEALGALGLRDEARRSLTNLLRKYPESAYAKAARAKLEPQTSTQ
jgi:TolA-binding protein